MRPSPMITTLALFNSEHYINYPTLSKDENSYPELPSVFLLQDTSFYSKGFDELFGALREMFAATIGDDAEITIEFDGLELFLHEDNLLSKSISLSDLMDLYLRLSKQDGIEKPEPLYMVLSTQSRFTKRYSELLAAAGDGKGLSQVSTYSSTNQYSGQEGENKPATEDNTTGAPDAAEVGDGLKSPRATVTEPPQQEAIPGQQVGHGHPAVSQQQNKSEAPENMPNVEGTERDHLVQESQNLQQETSANDVDQHPAGQANEIAGKEDSMKEGKKEEVVVEEEELLLAEEEAEDDNVDQAAKGDPTEKTYPISTNSTGLYIEEMTEEEVTETQLPEEVSEPEDGHATETAEIPENDEFPEELPADEVDEVEGDEFQDVENFHEEEDVHEDAAHAQDSIHEDDELNEGENINEEQDVQEEEHQDSPHQDFTESQNYQEQRTEVDDDEGQAVQTDTAPIAELVVEEEELLEYEEEDDKDLPPHVSSPADAHDAEENEEGTYGADYQEEHSPGTALDSHTDGIVSPTAPVQLDNQSLSSATVIDGGDIQSPIEYGASSHTGTAQTQSPQFDNQPHRIQVHQYEDDQEVGNATEGVHPEDQEGYYVGEDYDYETEVWQQTEESEEYYQQGYYHGTEEYTEGFAGGDVLGQEYNGDENDETEHVESHDYNDPESYEDYQELGEQTLHDRRSPNGKRLREEESDALDVQGVKRSRSD
ncbi:hypothetical protein BDZ91DRAFT_402782 [Kalaharituber pfeilii]|nr:hypothetical protein BDZ91DRAFT_402782 [Kalaharituber pfeilii]